MKFTAGETPTPQQIAKAREFYKLTMEEAAKLVHMKWQAFYLYEKGKRHMHPAFWELWNIKASIDRATKNGGRS